MSELWTRSATELARAIASGDISSSETVDAHIARIEAVNPALNAVVYKRYATARAEARAADTKRARGETLGALHGVPVTIKDSQDIAGTPRHVRHPVTRERFGRPRRYVRCDVARGGRDSDCKDQSLATHDLHRVG